MDLGFQSDGGGEGENQKRKEENKELQKIFFISVNVLEKVNGSNFHINFKNSLQILLF